IAWCLGLDQNETDAQTGNIHSCFVGIEPGEVLAEGFAHSIVAVRAQGCFRVDALAGRIEPYGMNGARIDDALDAKTASRIEHILGANDIRPQYALERVFDGYGAEVHHRAGALHHPLDRHGIAEVAMSDCFAAHVWADGAT